MADISASSNGKDILVGFDSGMIFNSCIQLHEYPNVLRLSKFEKLLDRYLFLLHVGHHGEAMSGL